MAEIAAAAGVSVPTVSKVLNRRSDVAPATRERIEGLLAEFGYGGAGSAQALKRRRSGLIDFVAYYLHSAYDLDIVRGVQEALEQTGMRLVLSATHGVAREERRWLAHLDEGPVVGAIVMLASERTAYLGELRRRAIPFVVIDRLAELDLEIPCISSANWAGARAATQHLLDLGHRRIGVLTGPLTSPACQDRLAGYRTALDSAAIAIDPVLIREGSFDLDAADCGYREANALLALSEPPTAIFAGNDVQAMGVYRALREHDLRIPEHISVVGFDDAPIASLALPALTTVRQPLVEMGRFACTILLGLLDGERPPSTRIELATTLVTRASCAPTPC